MGCDKYIYLLKSYLDYFQRTTIANRIRTRNSSWLTNRFKKIKFVATNNNIKPMQLLGKFLVQQNQFSEISLNGDKTGFEQCTNIAGSRDERLNTIWTFCVKAWGRIRIAHCNAESTDSQNRISSHWSGKITENNKKMTDPLSDQVEWSEELEALIFNQ